MHQQRIIIGIVAVAVLLGAGYLFLYPKKDAQQDETSSPAAPTAYTNAGIGLSFSYPGGAGGYVLEERESSLDTEPTRSIVLMKTEDFERMKNPPEGGEGPAVIAVHVFSNTKKQFLLAWAMERTDYSAYNLKIGENSEEVVDGANALLYSADGLYSARYAVVAHGSKIYVFIGQYLAPEDPMRRDFDTLLESVRFIPETQPTAGKLDIGAICEGALIYMTFPDGAAADAFVKDCKDGKRPEVFERWKKDNGITDDRAI